jgi:uroporphyrinogen decarboxylase
VVSWAVLSKDNLSHYLDNFCLNKGELMNLNSELKINGRPASKERFMTALRGGEPDFVPIFDFLDSQPLYEHFLGHRPVNYNSTDAVTLSLNLGVDAVFIPYGGFKGYTAEIYKFEDADTYTDEWGTRYKTTGASWPAAAPVAHPIHGREDLQKFIVPDPTLPRRLDGIYEALEVAKGRVAVLGGVNGPLTALYEDPGFVHDLLQIGADYYREACKRMIDAGVDAILIAEDMGFDTSLLMSPAHFRRFLFPLLGKMIAEISARNIPVLLHCDGNINSIIDDLVELGIRGYNPVERKAHMDIDGLKKHFGNRLTLVGNVDSTGTLCSGTPEQVQAEVMDLIRNIAPGGSYILCSDSDIRNEMPVENVVTMLEIAEQFGRYPIEVPDK